MIAFPRKVPAAFGVSWKVAKLASLSVAALGLTLARSLHAEPDCASCHATVAAEWESSSHHRSATNVAYVSQLEREPLPFCRGCHAPQANPARPTPAAAAAAGIGCVDCHVGLTADHAQGNVPRARSCEGCHEFAFPTGTGLMQKTATEHRASAHAGESCASCHMPRQDRHRDHRFDVAGLVPQAVVVDATRAGPGRIALRLAPGAVGHAFPTGDLFRRLAVRVSEADGRRVSERLLGREFTSRDVANGTHARVEVRDLRVGAGLAPCFEMPAPAGPATVEIALERVDEPSLGRRDVLVRSRTVAWTGIVPANTKEQPCR